MKNLNYMIPFKIFMFTPSGRIGGLEPRGDSGRLQSASTSLEAAVFPAALLCTFYQNHPSSKFLR